MDNDLLCTEKERIEEAAHKRENISAFLAERGMDAMLIARHENIAWATAGLVDVRVGILRESGVAALLVTREGGAFYLTTNNEAARLAEVENKADVIAGVDLTAEPATVSELDRQLNLNEAVLRTKVTRPDHH